MLSRSKGKGLAIFIIFFLSFIGYHLVLLVFSTFGLESLSRYVTIPVRLIIVGLVIYLINRNSGYVYIKDRSVLFLFSVFIIFYLFRVLVDWNSNIEYYLSYAELLLYVVTFVVFPFIGFNLIRLNEELIEIAFKAIFYSGVIFSVLAAVLYSKFLGGSTRLNSTTANEWVLSPLALSYCSITVISAFSIYLLTNKVSFSKRKVIMVLAICLSIIPFLLGAGRGAVMAALFSYMFFSLSRSKFKHFIKSIFVALILIFGIVFLDEYSGSSLIERFTSIGNDIEENNSSAIRIKIWDSSLDQFLNNPIFGDKIAVNGWHGYPHNIFLETLQTIGFLGFVLLFILVVKGLIICYRIIKLYPKYSWVCIIFLQTLIQYSFSGAIYTASWFWLSLGFLFSINNFIYESSHNNGAVTKL